MSGFDNSVNFTSFGSSSKIGATSTNFNYNTQTYDTSFTSATNNTNNSYYEALDMSLKKAYKNPDAFERTFQKAYKSLVGTLPGVIDDSFSTYDKTHGVEGFSQYTWWISVGFSFVKNMIKYTNNGKSTGETLAISFNLACMAIAKHMISGPIKNSIFENVLTGLSNRWGLSVVNEGHLTAFGAGGAAGAGVGAGIFTFVIVLVTDAYTQLVTYMANGDSFTEAFSKIDWAWEKAFFVGTWAGIGAAAGVMIGGFLGDPVTGAKIGASVGTNIGNYFAGMFDHEDNLFNAAVMSIACGMLAVALVNIWNPAGWVLGIALLIGALIGTIVVLIYDQAETAAENEWDEQYKV